MAEQPAMPWWQRGVVYQIYPRSFCDTTGNGIGDLAGIERHLDHLADLGVDAVWLSPIAPSPMADFGYDVADYCDVDALFGDLEAFDRLLDGLHRRGIRLILDWVPNHTSDQHPWFVDARSGPDAPHRDWYVWRPPAPDGGPPNNWQASFPLGTPAWTFDEASGEYYLHLFLREQPDLNWENPAVQAAMLDVLRFWLDRGVDGFRADVVHCIGKDPSLPSLDTEDGLPLPVLHNDEPATHRHLRAIRRLLDSYDGDRMMVGEIILGTRQVATYYGEADDELHLAFNFTPLWAPWEEAAWRRRIERTIEELDRRGAWPTWVLSNHDNVRHRSRYGTEARARASAVLLLTLRGTPFLYAGEELGLEDADVPPERVVDPGRRDGCRAPLPWTPGTDHGWSGEPWLPWPPDPATHNAATQADDPDSMLQLYRRLLTTRRRAPALHRGAFDFVDAPAGVLAYARSHADQRLLVAINFTDDDRPLEGFAGTVAVSTRRLAEHRPFTGVLGPDEAVVVDPSEA